MSRLVYADLRHDCEMPDTEHLPKYGERHQVIARWRCPVCRQRWAFEASFLNHDRFYWTRVGGPCRRWRKAKAAQLATLDPTSEVGR